MARVYVYRALNTASDGEVTSLWVERFPVSTLQQMRIQQGSINFDCQYQNQPIDPEGNMLKREWLHFYSPDALPSHSDLYFVQGVDPCYSEATRSDFFSEATLGVSKQGQVYAVSLSRAHLDPQSEIDVIARLYKQWLPRKVGIESNAGQKLLVQLVASHAEVNDAAIEGAPTKGQKEQRFADMAAYFQRGQILIPGHVNEEGEWHPTPEWVPFVDEWLSFPLGAHDDTLDAMEKAISVLSLTGEAAYATSSVFSGISTRLSSRIRPNVAVGSVRFKPVIDFGYSDEEFTLPQRASDELPLQEAKDEMYRRNHDEGSQTWGITLGSNGKGWVLKRR